VFDRVLVVSDEDRGTLRQRREAKVFPRVLQCTPDSRLFVVGSRPPPHIRRLAGDATGIVVTGYLEDVNLYLGASAMLVVPLHSGSGMRVKILEAFARGISVVSTTIDVEGIDPGPANISS
jgi:glycosyltransferase involved in cell wall biosynthesis